MKYQFLFSLSAVFLAGTAFAGIREHQENMLRIPGLIRFYPFTEESGDEVANKAVIRLDQTAVTGGPLGSMTVNHIPPSNQDVNSSHMSAFDSNSFFSARRTSGRFPGKYAMVTAYDRKGLWRNGITGKEFAKGGTISLWLRPRPENIGAGARLMDLGDNFNNGFLVTYSKPKWASKGLVSFRFGGDGHVTAFCSPVPEIEWTNVAVVFGNGKVISYVNGRKVEEKLFKGPVKPVFVGTNPLCEPFHEFSQGRFGEYMHVLRNHKFTKGASALVDLDELAIFNRPLHEKEIAFMYESGKPVLTPEQQHTDFMRILNEERISELIKVDVSHETGDFFRVDKNVPMTLTAPAETGDLTAEISITTVFGKPVRKQNVTIPAGKSVTADLQTKECGVFNLALVIKNKAGITVKKLPEGYCFGIVPPQPKELSELNPIAYWAETDNFCYDAPLRRMQVHPDKKVRMKYFKDTYDHYKKHIPGFRPYIWFYGHLIKQVNPKSRDFNREIFQDVITFMKDKPMLGFEVSSEPHNVDPKWYTQCLADLRDVMAKNNFKTLVVPPGGAPPSLPMIEEIMNAGGLQYVDGLSYHPYPACPVFDFVKAKGVSSLKKVIDRFPQKKLIMWNTEGGINSLPRISGRPMTAKDALSAKFRSFTSGGISMFPFFITLIEEEKAAALQCHAAMLDMAMGFQIYTICQSPNLDTKGLPSLRGVAMTALAGQILNCKTKVDRVPLAVADRILLMIHQKDGSCIASLFSMYDGEVTLKLEPGKTYKTMDMYGNFGSVTADAEGLIKFNVSVKPQYIFGVPKDIREIVQLRLSVPAVLPEKRIMKGTVQVLNPGKKELKGVLSMVPLNGAKLELAETEVQLKPGESKDIALTLTAETLRRSEYSLRVKLTDKSGKGIAIADAGFYSPGILQTVQQIKTPFNLDCSEAKWKNIRTVYADTVDSVVHGKPNYAEVWLPQWTGKDDLSFSLKTAWCKDDGIYFLLNVTDNKLFPASKENRSLAFRYDCLELFFDGRPLETQGKSISPGADQAVIIPSVKEQPETCDLFYAKGEKKVQMKVECVGKRTVSGYVIEGKIIPKAPGTFRVRAGSQFRMDFLVDDTDELIPARLRKAAMALHGKFSNFINSDLWGRYELGVE